MIEGKKSKPQTVTANMVVKYECKTHWEQNVNFWQGKKRDHGDE